MGTPKLLLPWGERLLIDQVLASWTASRVFQVIVVVRREDAQLTRACQRHDVRVLHPATDPKDMKESVQCGLKEIETAFAPRALDRCFIAPADLPTLSAPVIDRLIAAESNASTIVVPQFGARIGHPALLPWPMTGEIFELAEQEGVDRVVKRHPKLTVPFPEDQRIEDVDTPEEYQRLSRRVSAKLE